MVSQSNLRTNEAKTKFFEIWRPPEIVETKPPIRHKVKPDEVRRPDLISHRFYGDKTFYWAIAIRNNLLLPFAEMEEGQLLLIPQFDDVIRALQAGSET